MYFDNTPSWLKWSKAVIIVKPETVIRWHRMGFRLHWRWTSFVTWEAAVAEGILEDIEGFCSPEHHGPRDFGISRSPTEYVFSGRGPFNLYTAVHVSKATGQPTHFYVEFD